MRLSRCFRILKQCMLSLNKYVKQIWHHIIISHLLWQLLRHFPRCAEFITGWFGSSLRRLLTETMVHHYRQIHLYETDERNLNIDLFILSLSECECRLKSVLRPSKIGECCCSGCLHETKGTEPSTSNGKTTCFNRSVLCVELQRTCLGN